VGGDPIDIRRLPAGFEARITSLTDLDNGKSRVERKMAQSFEVPPEAEPQLLPGREFSRL